MSIIGLSIPAMSSASCDYGMDTCKQGYVWREATACDHVCVIPSVRSQAQQDNASMHSRFAYGGAYGPYTCKPGYVWREAYPGDRVCVTPDVRTQAHADNGAAISRFQGC